jgi:hypothetical protein
MHVIDADEDLGEPNEESVVQEVGDEEGEGGEEGEGQKPGMPKPGEEQGEGDPQKGQGKPGEEGGDGKEEGGSGQDLVGRRVRITAGPNAGQMGTIKQVLPNGDIIIQ